MTTRDCSVFFSGMGAGVCLALLLAPRSGAQLRSGLHDKVDLGRQKLRETKTAAYQAMERERDGISAALDAGKQAYREATGRAKQGAETHVAL